MVVKVNVSFSKDLLEKVDEAAKEAKTSRSALLSQAVKHYLQEREEAKLLKSRREAAQIMDNFRETYGPWDGTAEVLKWRDLH